MTYGNIMAQAHPIDTTSSLDLLLFICTVCGTVFSTSDQRGRRQCGSACAAASKRAHRNERQTRYSKSHPTRIHARQVLKNAVLAGKVRRPVRCESCGELGQTEGHHEDYTKPFFVEWLCRACHAGLEDGRHFGAGQVKEPINA
jgi:hypothetical protein